MKRFCRWLVLALICGFVTGSPAADSRPNIVWIVGEDLGPELGCYGDLEARTPAMDALAAQGTRFTKCFTHAPVCAPSRSGLITGRYPTSIGTHHMRSTLLAPPPTFTSLLRKGGYFVTWPGKTDFNFAVSKDAFDSTNNWMRPGATNPPSQPFFAYINLGTSHESQIRATPAQQKRNTARLQPADFHDPARMKIPPYHPDAPEVRRDLANYYDVATAVDYQLQDVLNRLDRLGVGSNTVVFFFGDHGRGLPRSKRWVHDSGTHVPLMVRWPGTLKPGSVRNDLVAFVDFAPTVLALAGVEVPKEFQGQIFLGPKAAAPRQYVFAARDRMDETPDRIRSVRDARYRYIRNFRQELPYAQRVEYGEEMPTMRVWRQLNYEGKLTGPQKLFFQPVKPLEELYDCEVDPHEINNLAANPKHAAKLKELRAALDKWIADTKDLGAMPEEELIKQGLITDRLRTEYLPRIKPLEIPLEPRK